MAQGTGAGTGQLHPVRNDLSDLGKGSANKVQGECGKTTYQPGSTSDAFSSNYALLVTPSSVLSEGCLRHIFSGLSKAAVANAEHD
jgi:hypothetical protein